VARHQAPCPDSPRRERYRHSCRERGKIAHTPAAFKAHSPLEREPHPSGKQHSGGYSRVEGLSRFAEMSVPCFARSINSAARSRRFNSFSR